jgi:hypothetical protein
MRGESRILADNDKQPPSIVYIPTIPTFFALAQIEIKVGDLCEFAHKLDYRLVERFEGRNGF